MFVFFAALTRAWFVASNFHHTANHRLAYGVLVSTGECGTHVSFAPAPCYLHNSETHCILDRLGSQRFAVVC